MRAFLLVETSGPWGVDAVRDARLPAAVRTGLRRLPGVRPLLIRRHGRPTGTAGRGTRVFAGYADPHAPWLESGLLGDVDEVLDLDLGALAVGRSAGLTPVSAPLFLTCTHGRHDRCCAERGRPVAAALARSHPDESWEVSHIGGDRFAGNLLVLPEGLYYGRVEAVEAGALADRHLAGQLDLPHLRGRCGYGFAVQAAEWHLRSRLELTDVRAVRLDAARTVRGAMTEATFTAVGSRWRVRVHRSERSPQLLTCGADQPSPVPVHELVGIDPLG